MQTRPVIKPKTPTQIDASALARTAERKVAERLARLLESLQNRLDGQQTALHTLQSVVGIQGAVIDNLQQAVASADNRQAELLQHLQTEVEDAAPTHIFPRRY